jgi:hypothetical protein
MLTVAPACLGLFTHLICCRWIVLTAPCVIVLTAPCVTGARAACCHHLGSQDSPQVWCALVSCVTAAHVGWFSVLVLHAAISSVQELCKGQCQPSLEKASYSAMSAAGKGAIQQGAVVFHTIHWLLVQNATVCQHCALNQQCHNVSSFQLQSPSLHLPFCSAHLSTRAR